MFTVAEYDEGVRKARTIGTIRGLCFWELIWTRGAPPVEELRIEPVETVEGGFQIRDPQAYDAQMCQLLGIL